MSYSFSVKATSKAEAQRAVAERFRDIVDQQPAHDRDSTIAMNAAAAAVDLLGEDAGKDVAVGMYGSVKVSGGVILGVGLTVNAYLTPRT